MTAAQSSQDQSMHVRASDDNRSLINASECLIQLRDLEKRYQTKAGFTYVLRQIQLDVKQGDFVMELFQQLNQGGTPILQVTHNPDWAKYSHRIVTLKWMGGKVEDFIIQRPALNAEHRMLRSATVANLDVGGLMFRPPTN